MSTYDNAGHQAFDALVFHPYRRGHHVPLDTDCVVVDVSRDHARILPRSADRRLSLDAVPVIRSISAAVSRYDEVDGTSGRCTDRPPDQARIGLADTVYPFEWCADDRAAIARHISA